MRLRIFDEFEYDISNLQLNDYTFFVSMYDFCFVPFFIFASHVS